MRRLTTALAAAVFFAALPCVSEAATQRVAHTATLLSTGDLLIVGGVNQTGTTLASADIFAASLGNVIVPTGALGVARASHTATLMSNGCVLIAGGNVAATDVAAPSPSTSLEVYNPATSLFTSPGALTTARYNHTATLLNTGVVQICGGQNAAGAALNSCEFYTPTSCTAGTVSAAPTLLQARYNHTATLLKDGKVWYAGGRNPAAVATGGYLVTTERYDPTSNAFASASPMIEARSNHTATLMGDGKALVVGGYTFRNVLANQGVTESAEIYDPISNSVTPAAAMSARRQSHATTLSANGQVAVFGGLGNVTTTYVSAFSPAGNPLTAPSNATFSPISAPTATITGGTIQAAIDMLLSKPVIGQIVNGEIWLSSPVINTTWGMINFVPSDNLNSAIGIRINTAGQQVGCRLPYPPVTGNCGNLATLPLTPVAFSNLQGQAVFNRRLGITLGGSPLTTAGTLTFAPGTIDGSNANATLNPAGSNFTTTIQIAMDADLVGYQINSGYINLAAASLVQVGSYTVTLSSGGGPIPVGTNITADASGNGVAIFPITFSKLEGSIAFTGVSPMAFNSPLTIPAAGSNQAVTAAGNMTYTASGANLSANSFTIDVATIIVRKMIFADAETYDPTANSWTLAPPDGVSIADQRYGHSATLLPNNDTVYVGGRACVGPGVACGTQVATANTGFQLLFSEKNFAATSGTAAGVRALHTATMLDGGDILLAGGTNGPSVLSSAELFTPGLDTFSPVNGGMRYVRDLHSATLLPNGRVLIAGGFTTNASSTGSTNTAELYYPDTKRFIETAPMISSRSNHTAIMLPDGRVFVAGGFGPGDVVTGTSEIFVSTQSKWMAAATMPGGCERAIGAAVQRKNGHILVFGGVNATGPLDTTADYDPVANSWNCGSVTVMPTPLRSHSATLLFDGRVLVAGGNDGLGEANKSFIYDPVSNTWTSTHPTPLLYPRFNHTSNILPNGNVMITGGSQRFGNVPPVIEVFHVNGSSWVTGGVGFLAGPRAYHTMTLGPNNKMYAIGGSDGVIGGTGVSLYTSAETGYFGATPDSFSKGAPPSFRQSVINTTSATPFLPGTNLTVTGIRFRGGTEASGGGAASANSAFSYPHISLTQIDGSNGGGSQANGGFVVDLTTQIFLNPANLATLDTSLTVALPATNNQLPYGWYTLRTGANDIFSDSQFVQVGPAKPTVAPTNITGIAAGVSSMTWSWDAVAGVDGYNVYCATTGIFITSIPVSLATRATFYQTGLDASATEAIAVAGYTLTGDGPLALSPTSYTLSTTPINVTIASVTFSDLLLFWGPNGNAFPGTTYEVTESSDNFVNDVSTPVPTLFNLSTNFTVISNLAANTTYFFRVRAFNIVGLPSPYSVIVSTRTRAPVTQPIVAGRTTTSIDWGWADPGGVTNYRVYNATSGVFLAAPVLNTFTEVGLGTNTQHSIRVTAVTNAGEGPLSPSASAYTNAATPGVAIPPISGLTTGSFLVNWTNNGNPLSTNYRVNLISYAPDGSIVSITTTVVPAGNFNQGFGGLTPSGLYGYAVVAVNGDIIASDIPPVVVGSTYTLPNAPNPLNVLGTTPTSISVSWPTNNNTSSATYQVTYTTDNFTLNISTAISFAAKYGGTIATINGLVTSATYSVRVIASNPYGQLSQFSNVVTTQTFNGGAPPGSIQGIMYASHNSDITGSLGNGRAISLRAPAQAFPSDVLITLSSYTPTGPLCPGATVIAFSIVDSPALQPVGSLYLTFDFTLPELGTIAPNRALLLRYDPVSGSCVPLETTVDTVAGQMTARINHFSLFQVGTVPLSTTAETARIFPNPYYTSRDGYVTIDNIPPAARVRIFTLRGEEVLDVKANSTGVLTWSGTNGSGRAVASGVYLVMIESGGTKKILKLAVIR